MKNRYLFLFVAALLVFCNTGAAQTSRFENLALTGGFNGWRANGAFMRLVADDTWETEIYLWDMPSDYFKFVADATWYQNTNIWGDSTQTDFNVPITGTATFQPGDGGDIRVDSIQAGFYRFRFNDITHEYSISLMYTTNSGVNLIKNPAFLQQGSAANRAYHWEGGNPDSHGGYWGHVERINWGGYCGEWHGAIEAKWNSYDDDFGGWWQEGPAEAGYTYEASCWIYADRNINNTFTAVDYELKIEFYSTTYQLLATELVNFEHDGQNWHRISAEALAPPSTAWARFVIYCGGMGNQGALRFDNVQMRKKASRSQDFNDWVEYTNDACHEFDWKLCEGKVVSNVLPEVSGQLIISEYVEGSSYNKALELYNGTDFDINLGAGDYRILVYSAGSSTPNYNTGLTGIIEAASAYVLVSSDSRVNAALIALADERVYSISRFNGDDAIELRQGGASGTIIDSFGQVGDSPGSSGWGGVTTDHTLQRKSTVTEGRTASTDPFDPYEEWTVYPADDFTGLGSHTMSGGGDYLPSGLSASIAPANGNYIQSGQLDGIGNISFWYRALSDSTPMTYAIQTSDESGTNWVTQDTLSDITNTAYASYLLPLYVPEAQYMRIYHTAGDNRLLVDDIEVAVAVSNAISRTQNFNAWTNATSYGAHSSDDGWELTNGRSVSNEARTGYCGWLVTNSFLQSPFFENGVGSIEFYYKRDNASTNPVQFDVQYSTNGSDWTIIESYDAIGNSEYEAASVYAYLPQPGYIRFANLEFIDPDTNALNGACLVLDDISVGFPLLYSYQDFNSWPSTSYGDSSFRGWSVHAARITTDMAYD
ncbi:MAG: hypothetical protein EOM20_18115, partial [Spartobacteria bacterium]|nr:hypothetical protein [Spartobacteria bacterium]